MQLEDLIANNVAFLEGKPKATHLASPIALLTCIDCRLNDYLGPALGIIRDGILLVRNAGNVVSDSSGDPLRSLAMAIYLKGATEILVLGHTDCRLSQFEANAFLDAMTRWGVARQQLGPVDLRRWAGAFHDPLQNVKRSVELISQCGFIPRKVPVHGLLIDIQTGKLEIAVDGNKESARRSVGTAAAFSPLPSSILLSTSAGATTPMVAVEEPSKPARKPVESPSPKEAAPSPAVASPPLPVVIPAPAPVASAIPEPPKPKDLMGAIRVLRQFIWELRNKKEYKNEMDAMRAKLAREQDPVRSFQIIEETAHRLSAGRADVVAALRIVRDHVARSPVGAYVENLLQQILKI